MMWLLLLTGCVQNVFFPPDRTRWNGADTGDTQRTAQFTEISCDDGSHWWWTARSDGWVQRGTLNIFRLADGVTETHDMVRVATDRQGEWDELMTGPLGGGVSAENQESGVNSQFACALDQSRLTGVARFYGPGDDLVDCVAFGDDPQAALVQIQEIDPFVSAIGGCRFLND